MTRSQFFAALVAFLSCANVLCFPFNELSMLLPRQGPITGLDVEDLGFVRKWAAIGDSYAAGIGSGTKLSDSGSCSRYDNSYPAFINSYELMPTNPAPTFEFHACSGATSKEVLDNQVSKLGTEYDIITISAGGNDVGLKEILDACIYQWHGGNDKKCDDQMQTTRDKILNELPGDLDRLYTAVKPKISAGRKIYVTGYARFFDDTTSNCNNVSWSFWFNRSNKQFLTQGRRATLNNITVEANNAIEAAVKKAGDPFEFVGYDQYFEQLQGRFCEPGVNEPAGNRPGLLMFQWSTNDDETQLKARDKSGLERLFARFLTSSDMPELERRQGSSNSTNATLTFEEFIAQQVKLEQAANSSLEVSLPDNSAADPAFRGRGTIDISSFIPDSMKRVFHPRPGGHALIANLILWRIADNQARSPGGPGGWGPEAPPVATECAIPKL